MARTDDKSIRCSFCGKRQDQVKRMIAGPGVYICDECVGLCMEAVEDGSFGGEVIYGTLQNGALSAGALSDLVPADVQEKYQGYLDQMVDGSFMQ